MFSIMQIGSRGTKIQNHGIMLSLLACYRSENLEDSNLGKLLTEPLQLPLIMLGSEIDKPSPKVLNK